MTTIRFEKLDGAGNDFVLLTAPVPVPSSETIRALLDRHRGIGGDGLLHLERRPEGSELDAVVGYWNADGGRAEFCGNGARCIAAVLLEGSEEGREVRFRLSDVVVRARADANGYAVAHPAPRDLPSPKGLPLGPGAGEPVYLDSGVPHFVVPVADLVRVDVGARGAELRRHPDFGPAGTNVDFVALGAPGAEGVPVLDVRTYERGVEGETWACGSGLLAAAHWARTRRDLEPPITLRSRSGERFRLTIEDGLYWLSGPARRVFRGEIALP